MAVPSWPQMHGAVTHFPVAMLMAAFLFDLGAVALRKREWETVAFWMVAVGAAGAAGAVASGLPTAHTVFAGVSPLPRELVLHRAAGLSTAVAAIIQLSWRIGRRNDTSSRARAITLALAALTALCVSVTGYLGGRMALG